MRLGCLGGKSQRAQRRHVGCEARPNEESVHRRIPFFCLGSFPPMETLTRRECVRNAPTALLLTRRCEQAGADPCAGMRDTLTIIIESRYEQKRPDHAGMPTAAFKKGTPPCRKRELSPKFPASSFRAPRHLRSSRRVSMWVDASVSRPTVCRECRYRETGRRMAGPVTTAGTKCGSRIITNMTRTRKREKEFAAQVAIGWRSRWWYATRWRHGP